MGFYSLGFSYIYALIMKRVYFYKYYSIALLTVLLDQVSKLIVHFNMEMGALGQINLLGDWLKIHYILNPGMAFGLEMGFQYGKPLLTFVRIGITYSIGKYMWKLLSMSAKLPAVLLWGWALIFGGAVGNVTDSIFYGVLLGNAPYGAPTPWFYGQVIDMVFLDICEVAFPSWMPLLGGDYLSLFPVFNLADLAIFWGVIIVLFVRRKTILKSLAAGKYVEVPF